VTVKLADRPSVPVPPALLDALIRRFNPVRVILFGSRARGDSGPDSDWDLMVVVDDDLPPELRTVRAAFEAIAGTGIAADVVPVRASTFDHKRDVVNSLPWFASREGLLVYERPGRREGA
jgi:predicted nucleotidyltransferase